MSNQYRIEIHKDVSYGLPPSWFWSVSFNGLVARNVCFTKWGAKRAAAKFIARKEKTSETKKITYEINT